MNKLLWVLLLALSGLVQPLANAASKDYPYRMHYPDVLIISTEELVERINEVLVVDVRSKFEFDTLHIKDAVNVPLTTGFGEKMVQLRATNNKPFVFYCNGNTSHKSYDAVLLSEKAGLDKVYAYDAGIFDWAKAQPEMTVLLGRSPIRAENLIDESSFKVRLIGPKDFAARVGDKSVVLDVRDRVQSDAAHFPFKEQRTQAGDPRKIDTILYSIGLHSFPAYRT